MRLAVLGFATAGCGATKKKIVVRTATNGGPIKGSGPVRPGVITLDHRIGPVSFAEPKPQARPAQVSASGQRYGGKPFPGECQHEKANVNLPFTVFDVGPRKRVTEVPPDRPRRRLTPVARSTLGEGPLT
jgi:hypothetical protein